MAKSSIKAKRAAVAAGTVAATRGDGVVLTVTATEAKNRFGPLLETVIRGRTVVITKHDTPKAVLLSMAEFEALGGSTPPSLDALSSEFDSLLTRMQTPASRSALKAAFAATPADLGRLAVANQRRRG